MSSNQVVFVDNNAQDFNIALGIDDARDEEINLRVLHYMLDENEDKLSRKIEQIIAGLNPNETVLAVQKAVKYESFAFVTHIILKGIEQLPPILPVCVAIEKMKGEAREIMDGWRKQAEAYKK